MSTWRLLAIGVVAACGAPEGDAGVTVTPIDGLATSEAGDTAQFTVVLDRYPDSPVTVPFESSGVGEGTAEPSSLTFTSANWDLPQTVMVRGVDDDAADGDVAYTIMTLPATSGDGSFAGIDADDVSLVNRDNDVAGFVITPTTGLTTSENGATAESTIRLATRPDADVTLGLTSSRPDEGIIDRASLTFTTESWDQPQAITIGGVDDVMADGIRNYAIITQPAQSGDPDYDGLDPADISIANLDNDTPGITVTPVTGLATSEAGATATFTIVLDSKPRASVTIGLSSSDPEEGTVSPSSVTFTTTNWLTPHTITVTGQDDAPAVDDGERSYTIVTAPATSTDASYRGLDAADVEVANDDDDDPGFTFIFDGIETTEAGGQDELFIKLDTRPTADVVIGISSDDLTEGTVDVTALTFTPANWNIPARIVATGVDDDLDQGDASIWVIVTAAATSSDPSYAGLDPHDVPATNLDDDVSEIIVNPTSITTSEAGGADSFTVVLTAEPTADVTILLYDLRGTEGTLSTTELTFTPATGSVGGWNVPQTVTVTGRDDDYEDGPQDYVITMNGGGYDSVPPAVTVTNLDDDTSGLVIEVSPAACGVGSTTAIETDETGAIDCFSVRLASRPSADEVTIPIASSDTSEGIVDKASLVFTPGDWDAPQIVTVTGVDDVLLDGTRSYEILVGPTVTEYRTPYDGLEATIAATNADVL